MTQVFHLPGLTGPLCGRILSRNTPLTIRDQSTMVLGAAPGSPAFASGQEARKSRPCRHCQRAAGLLPPLTRPTRNPEGDLESPEWDLEQEESEQ